MEYEATSGESGGVQVSVIEPFSFKVALRFDGWGGVIPVKVIDALVARLPAASVAVMFPCQIVVVLSIALSSSLKPSEKLKQAALKSVGFTLLTIYPGGFDVHELVVCNQVKL